MLNNFLFDQQSVNRLIVAALALISTPVPAPAHDATTENWKKFPGEDSVGQYNNSIS